MIDVTPVAVRLPDATIRVRDVRPEVRGAAGAVAIARLPAGRSEIVLSGAALAALMRRAVPGVSAQSVQATRFRRTIAARVPAPSFVPERPAVTAGEALTLVARNGVVTVERRVTALQPARAGGRVFVRDGAGRVFAAPVQSEAR
ncbi:MAG: flagella basal body P-ring formation protein FlgA [Sphingomonas phyllosphaerae]|uniref:flagella basal body P-ring formation protein FlgA n=1 Tax=Sphingomonas phyllosphaerae TaxID=257003 RepID=UPI002FFB06E9